MDSIYFRDPNGQLLEMACFKFMPPEGHTYADVLSVAHRMRLEKGDYAIADNHLADAIAELTEKKIKIHTYDGLCRKRPAAARDDLDAESGSEILPPVNPRIQADFRRVTLDLALTWLPRQVPSH